MNKEYWKGIFLYEFSLISLVIVSILYKNNFFINKKDISEALNNQRANITDSKYYLPITNINKNDASVLLTKKEEEKKENINNTVQIASVEDHEIDIEEEINFSRDLNIKNIEEKFKSNVKKIYYTNITSYNSEAAQTDSTPCITASGMNVCIRDMEDIVATNDLPLHTKVLIPEYFGERIFYVEDRMNVRYTGTGRIDIWMKSKDNSKKWGIKNAKIIVLK